MIKVAHMVKVTPGNYIVGLYATVVELVQQLRMLGWDSRLVETDIENNSVFPHDLEHDRGCPIEKLEWGVNEADIIVSHSGYSDEIANTGKPIVYCAHGRPSVSYVTERDGGLPLISYFYKRERTHSWKAVVTFWQEHKPYLDLLFRETPVRFVPAPVDLKHWSPGPATYDFGGKAGEVNIVISDSWREDVDPWHVLNAAGLFARRHKDKGVRIHLYGMPKQHKGAWPIINTLEEEGLMGEYRDFHDDLREPYRAANAVVTPHTIAVRTRREAMACGCPIVCIPDGTPIGYESLPKWVLWPMDSEGAQERRKVARQLAERHHDPRVAGRVMDDVLSEAYGIDSTEDSAA